jgi:hypothetical protein
MSGKGGTAHGLLLLWVVLRAHHLAGFRAGWILRCDVRHRPRPMNRIIFFILALAIDPDTVMDLVSGRLE